MLAPKPNSGNRTVYWASLRSMGDPEVATPLRLDADFPITAGWRTLFSVSSPYQLQRPRDHTQLGQKNIQTAKRCSRQRPGPWARWSNDLSTIEGMSQLTSLSGASLDEDDGCSMQKTRFYGTPPLPTFFPPITWRR